MTSIWCDIIEKNYSSQLQDLAEVSLNLLWFSAQVSSNFFRITAITDCFIFVSDRRLPRQPQSFAQRTIRMSNLIIFLKEYEDERDLNSQSFNYKDLPTDLSNLGFWILIFYIYTVVLWRLMNLKTWFTVINRCTTTHLVKISPEKTRYNSIQPGPWNASAYLTAMKLKRFKLNWFILQTMKLNQFKLSWFILQTMKLNLFKLNRFKLNRFILQTMNIIFRSNQHNINWNESKKILNWNVFTMIE